MTNNDLAASLNFEADKLQMMWGGNPTSNLLRAASAALLATVGQAPVANTKEPAPKQAKAKPVNNNQ